MTLRALLAALALAAAGSSQALTLAGDGQWLAFDVDELSATNGGLQWIDITAGGTPLTLEFTIDAGFFGVLTVVGGGFAGDRFSVFNGAALLGQTSAAGTSYPDSLGLDFDAALADSRYSSRQFVLGAGTYGITGALVESVTLGGVALNATVGGARLEVSPVPEPATWATLALGLGLGLAAPPGPRGGPVFDRNGQLAGVATGGVGEPGRLVPWQALAAGIDLPTPDPAVQVAGLPDVVYEHALRAALQVLVPA